MQEIKDQAAAQKGEQEDVLIDICGLQKSFGKNAVLRGIDTKICRGEKVAIIGAILAILGGVVCFFKGSIAKAFDK